jgi:hypothetical protein
MTFSSLENLRRLSRAEAIHLGIRSLMSFIFSFALRINNPLKHNGICCRFRAKMALLDNLAAGRSAL